MAGAGALPISLVLTSREGCLLPTPAICLRVFSWPWKHSWRQLKASRKCWRVNVPGSSLQPVTKRELEDKYPASLPGGVHDLRHVSYSFRSSPAGLHPSCSRGSITVMMTLPELASCPSFSLSHFPTGIS